ncbi:ATP-binding protein [Methylocella sp. CPCC 101449]|nr:ATP-binding protein [Methylocella sp. CPCC 101449]MDT2024572.1 ATP-binding protein [Methylocella sp. CPCC 101449]
MAIAAIFVIISQLKINVTNSYAGSIAWSNFFSRLTHSHPGRVVWLVFNVVIALLLMELGIYKSLEHTLGLYAHVAVAWVGTLVADLVINKPLGLSPRNIEFKRAHLYDINPVGFGSMLIASLVSICAYMGLLGDIAGALSCFIGLAVAFVMAPLIAYLTKGRFYIARAAPSDWAKFSEIRCCICEHHFETEDMTNCPAYAGPICSLCCTLDARCNDQCKEKSRLSDQILAGLSAFLPDAVLKKLNSNLGHYLGLLILVSGTIGAVLALVYWQTLLETGPPHALIGAAMLKAFLGLALIAGIVCWLFVLAHESQAVAQEESVRQTSLLMQEIEAHERTDRELQKAKEAAEAANLAKSRYLVGISHEFRTPLNAILGYAQLIDRDGFLPPNRTNALRTIRRSGEHLAGLVEGLLDIAKIEAGKLELQRDTVRLYDFLEQIVDMFSLQAEMKGIGFSFKSVDNLPEYIRTDEKRLRQVLINLLSNAIKFTASGEVRFVVRCRNDVAEFAIEDTGIGIAPDNLDRIFMPFERIENPNTPWIPGTGLGLTITKLMTEVMGGKISVTSRLGAGSRFTVRLHLSVTKGPTTPADQAAAITGYLGPRLSVVVVDDEMSHRQLLADILTPLDIAVFLAEDGPSCLRLVEEVRPQLILLDITLPGMNGWELARRIRDDVGSSGAIIMVSAEAQESRRDAGMLNYHDDYIGKPFDVGILLDKIGLAIGLIWTREGVPLRPERSASPRFPREELPPRGDLLDLVALGHIGFIRAISDRLKEIAEREPQSSAFVNHLGELVADVQLDSFLAALEMALDDSDAATVA